MSNEAFEGALDRFAQFFIEPLLGENQTAREMKAVDSEYNMGLQSDYWRFNALQGHLSRKESAQNRFTCGNLETLQVPGIRDALINFHSKYYSANIMKLVVSSNETLAQLEQYVQLYFAPIPNKNTTRPDLSKPVEPFDSGNLG